MSDQIEVDIDDLLLDHDNPRLGSVESQAMALEELIRLSPRNFRTMMTSIKEHGLDPGDLFYLVDESEETGVEGYTVVDGNRRLSALKVLRRPSLLEGTNLPSTVVQKIRETAHGFTATEIGETRLCVLFEDRQESEDWILRRHGRGLEGEERIPWGPLEIQRFQGDRSILDIIDFAERSGTFDPDQWAVVRSKLEKRSYVLRRFLESKSGRASLGIGEMIEDGQSVPTSTRPPEVLKKILKRLLDDVASGTVDTRKYNKASDIAEYFDDLPDDWKPDATPEAPKPFRELHAETPSGDEGKAGPGSVAPPPSPRSKPAQLRPTLAPKRLEFKQPVNAKGQQFVREATRVQLREAPLSAAFLLRGFIQFVVDTYMKDNDIGFWENEKQLELHVRADRVIEHLIKGKVAKRGDLSGIKRRLSEKAAKNPSGIQALNDYHHDEFQVPDADALRAGWDDATALFVAILGRAGS